jgi:hypothetical protein
MRSRRELHEFTDDFRFARTEPDSLLALAATEILRCGVGFFGAMSIMFRIAKSRNAFEALQSDMGNYYCCHSIRYLVAKVVWWLCPIVRIRAMVGNEFWVAVECR